MALANTVYYWFFCVEESLLQPAIHFQGVGATYCNLPTNVRAGGLLLHFAGYIFQGGREDPAAICCLILGGGGMLGSCSISSPGPFP